MLLLTYIRNHANEFHLKSANQQRLALQLELDWGRFANIGTFSGLRPQHDGHHLRLPFIWRAGAHWSFKATTNAQRKLCYRIMSLAMERENQRHAKRQSPDNDQCLRCVASWSPLGSSLENRAQSVGKTNPEAGSATAGSKKETESLVPTSESSGCRCIGNGVFFLACWSASCCKRLVRTQHVERHGCKCKNFEMLDAVFIVW